METKEPIVVNLDLSLRALTVLILVVGLLTLVYAVSGAQDDAPPNTNANQQENPTVQPAAPPVVMPDPPAGMKDVVLTTNGEWISLASVGVAPASSSAPAAVSAPGSGRHFYLTDTSYATNQVKTACAAGYHTASLWEILDVSNLVYDYDHPAAHNKADNGYGPPTYWHGWVRTGWDSSGSSSTGTGNCLNWTSTSSANYGVSVRLSRTWETAPGDIFTWDANSFTCNFIGPVWCVRNN
jgi:hypothetical protein